MLRIGLDVGGTKTALVALDGNGLELLSRRTATPHGGYEDALEGLAALVLDAERELGSAARVGIGLPGLVSPAGFVRNSFATPYNERPLKADLEQRLERELRIENDANCFALSEATDGAARGARLVFGAILGTGAGGGIALDGNIIGGAQRGAGEWGHNPLPWMAADEFPGPRCSCGRLGCIEQFVSGSALGADHERVNGVKLAPEEITARADAGDEACARSLERLESRLARALAHVINLIDPDAIVLGGGLSNVDRLYENVPALWKAHVYAGSVATRLLRPAHGDASGVRGAAMLWETSPG